jgi:putative aldouronate transport system substrate-binding protein
MIMKRSDGGCLGADGLNRRRFCAIAVRAALVVPVTLVAACRGVPATTPAAAPTAQSATQAAPPATQAAQSATQAAQSGATLAVVPAPTIAPARGAAPAQAAGGGPAKMSSYVPVQAVAPDILGSADGLDAGYFSYPANPVRTVPNPPGRGGDVSMLTWNIASPITPMDQNPAWQQLNSLTGATLKPVIVPFADYQTRLPVIIAGDDLPDMLFLTANARVSQLADFLKLKCADLSQYLIGDAVKDYPNLAGLAPASWKGTIFNGGIYGVPIAYTVLLWNLWVHQELLDQLGVAQPTSADEFKRVLQQLTRPQSDVYGIAAEAGVAFNVGSGTGLHPQIFGAPNNWRVDGDGKFTRAIETDEFKASVDFARELFEAGAYSPNSLNYNNVSAKTDFAARKYAFRHDGWSAALQWWDQGAGLNPPGKLRIAHPFSRDGSTKPIFHLGPGYFGIVAIKKADPERIKELLRILNFFAAPFGSSEYLAINFGVEGTDFTRDPSGNPTLTDKGKSDVNSLWTYVSRPTPSLYNPRSTDYVSVLQEDEKPMLAAGISDPTVGLYSSTSSNKTGVLNQTLFDAIQEMVAGRRPMSDYDGLVKDWRAGGGDQMRAEYEQAYAASN